MSAWLSEQTWAQLDPAAARLTRRGRFALAAGLTAFVLVVCFVAGAVRSGWLSPRLIAEPRTLQVDPASRSFTETIAVHTDGWFDENVTGITVQVPRGTAAVLTTPRTIPRHGFAPVTFRVVLNDCSAVSSKVTMAVRVHRPWGTLTHTMTLGARGGYGSPFDSAGRAACRG